MRIFIISTVAIFLYFFSRKGILKEHILLKIAPIALCVCFINSQAINDYCAKTYTNSTKYVYSYFKKNNGVGEDDKNIVKYFAEKKKKNTNCKKSNAKIHIAYASIYAITLTFLIIYYYVKN